MCMLRIPYFSPCARLSKFSLPTARQHSGITLSLCPLRKMHIKYTPAPKMFHSDKQLVIEAEKGDKTEEWRNY